jgi:hypothetical protein
MPALRGTLRVNPLRLRLIFVVAVDTVLAILSLFGRTTAQCDDRCRQGLAISAAPLSGFE